MVEEAKRKKVADDISAKVDAAVDILETWVAPK